MKPRRSHKSSPSSPGYWLFGQHAVSAALSNPNRTVQSLLVTSNSLPKIQPFVDGSRHPAPEIVGGKELDHRLPEGSVHQGVAAKVSPLPKVALEDVLASESKRPIVLLDQVTDPHNVGAILRSAAAFNVAAVIVTEAHAPQEGAIIAKSASGAMEVVPLVEVVNLAKVIDQVKKAGYWVAGLDGEADKTLREAKLGADTAIVMGSEGKGLRRLTGEKCDLLVKLPMSSQMESLNVSNAAAIALYELFSSSL